MAESVVDNKVRRAVAGALIEFDDEKGVPLYSLSAFVGLSKGGGRRNSCSAQAK